MSNRNRSGADESCEGKSMGASLIQLKGGPLDGTRIKQRDDANRGIVFTGGVVRIFYMPNASDVFHPDSRGEKWVEYGMIDGEFKPVGSGVR